MQIVPITVADIDAFRACLDRVARERRFLAMFEAPPPAVVRAFVTANIAAGVAQVVAKEGDAVVGWCDVLPAFGQARRHCGTLGLGLLPEYRGQGLGRRLLEACLARAAAAGLTRIELEVRVDNVAARHLYASAGFLEEGLRRGAMSDGESLWDTVAMARLLPRAPD